MSGQSFFRRNVLGVSSVEFLWGLGFPIVLESTFLQLFLKKLGASSFTIGIVPSLFIFAISTFPLFSTYISRNFRRKRPLVMLLHLTSALAIILLGVALHFTRQPENALYLFFIAYTVFSLCLGLVIPIWLTYLVRLFGEQRMVQGFGFMNMAQNCGKVIASFFILKVVETYSFSLASSAYVFMVTGVLFFAGSLCFLITREDIGPDPGEEEKLPFFSHLRGAFAEILKNRKFLLFLAADLDFYIVLTVLSFYANYATGFFDVPAAVAAGTFVASIYAGAITVNIFLGAMNLLGLKQKFILAKFAVFLLLVLLAFFPGMAVFFMVSYLLGVARATRNVVYPPLVKKFAGKEDATSYYALAPILVIPISSGFPLLCGKVLDALSFMGADAYRLVFGGSALLVMVTIGLSLKMKTD